MLFSSTFFIFTFLPIVLLIYYLPLCKSRKLQNIFLLVASLFFYAWGEPKFVLVMILSIVVNYVLGLLVDRYRESPNGSKIVLAATAVFNLSVLFIFKYLTFTITNIYSLFKIDAVIPKIALPIGISFFTFQAMSYVFDVYWKRGSVQKNILNVGLYISFFPQLIAGPIVRYETVASQIESRKENLQDFSEGFCRFIIGFAKKVLLANKLALVADMAFDGVAGGQQITMAMGWLGAVCYVFQLFFDFSGYSDMAIGLGKMFGFHFSENFNYPFISRSFTELWRRWHISLGTWFRDYVYIPLGGSRVGTSRGIFNLFMVWLLTGVWHGANWTFIAWGILNFIVLIAEKYIGFHKTKSRIAAPFLWLYTMFFWIIGVVIFRANDIGTAISYVKSMFGIGVYALGDAKTASVLSTIKIQLIMAAVFSTPVVPYVKSKTKGNVATDILYIGCLAMLFVLSVASIVSNSYNPFIYFNF